MSTMRTATAVWAVLASGGIALGGPDWDEMTGPDAGNLPSTAQTPFGLGTLATIHGQLGGVLRGPGDFQDMYRICIADPAFFSAQVLGDTMFDTQLWLFDGKGRGVLGNDDAAPGAELSMLGNQATDGVPPFGIPGPGIYFLAISGFDSDPLSAPGPIFDQVLREEVSRPDGPGGTSPIIAWTEPGDVGAYTIRLTGVKFVPAPGAAAMLAVTAGALLRRRRT